MPQGTTCFADVQRRTQRLQAGRQHERDRDAYVNVPKGNLLRLRGKRTPVRPRKARLFCLNNIQPIRCRRAPWRSHAIISSKKLRNEDDR
jgi:hypothetical protein